MFAQLFRFSVIAFIGLSLSACHVAMDLDDKSWSFGSIKGSGDKASQTIESPAFTAIELKTAGDIELRIGSQQSLRLSSDDNLLDNFSFHLKGDTLVVDADKGYRSKLGMLLEVTVPDIEKIAINGSGDIRLLGEVELDELSADIHGSGDIVLENVSLERLDLKVSGSGDIKARGKVTRLTAQVNGSGDLALRKLVAEQAKVRVNGSGEVEVHVRESLDARVAGSGDVYYLGEPKLSVSISGSGEVSGL